MFNDGADFINLTLSQMPPLGFFPSNIRSRCGLNGGSSEKFGGSRVGLNYGLWPGTVVLDALLSFHWAAMPSCKEDFSAHCLLAQGAMICLCLYKL